MEGLEANQYVVCSLSWPAQCFFLTFPIFCIKLYPLNFHTSLHPYHPLASSSLLWTQSIINFCPIELGRCPRGRPPAKTVFCRGLNQLNKGPARGRLIDSKISIDNSIWLSENRAKLFYQLCQKGRKFKHFFKSVFHSYCPFN